MQRDWVTERQRNQRENHTKIERNIDRDKDRQTQIQRHINIERHKDTNKEIKS